MFQYTQKLEAVNYYHVYNRGINSYELFSTQSNYAYFLRLYDKYISPVELTYA